MPLRVGFTGTRMGMSEVQKDQLDWVLGVLTAACRHSVVYGELEFHHGNSPDGGADQEAEEIAALHLPAAQIIHHDPSDRSSKAMLARNREIASHVHMLIAAPESHREEVRSGTWATVRYARAERLPIIMLSRG